MSEQRIADRYAKSLIDLASEKGSLDAIYSDMLLIQESCKGSRELVNALSSPIIKFDKKLAILNAVFQNKVNAVTAEYFNLLAKKHRAELLYPISQAFIEQYNKLKGIQKAHLYTPVKIDDTLRQQFLKIVEEKTGKKAEIEEHIKQDLIGGFILRIGDIQIDDSVQSKLSKIKTNFTENQYIPKL